MNVAKKLRNKVAFVITDETGHVWGMAPTKIQARRQIAWFLPRELKLSITIQVIPVD